MISLAPPLARGVDNTIVTGSDADFEAPAIQFCLHVNN